MFLWILTREFCTPLEESDVVNFSALVDVEEQSFSSNFVRNFEHTLQGFFKLFIIKFNSFRHKHSKKLVPVIDQDFKFSCSTSENSSDS